MDKQSFVSTIRDWLACDAELARLQRQARELREKNHMKIVSLASEVI